MSGDADLSKAFRVLRFARRISASVRHFAASARSARSAFSALHRDQEWQEFDHRRLSLWHFSWKSRSERLFSVSEHGAVVALFKGCREASSDLIIVSLLWTTERHLTESALG